MSVILIASILLWTVAVCWTLVVLRRLRDWRVLFLTAMLVLMTSRQVLTLGGDLASRVLPDAAAHLDELPGLLVSVMALLLVMNFEGLATRGHRCCAARLDNRNHPARERALL